MIYLPCLSSVQIVLTLVAMICDMSFLHLLNLVGQFVMIYILVLIWKLPKISKITALESIQVALLHLHYHFQSKNCLANDIIVTSSNIYLHII
jgi:hypothetical protein